MPVELRRCELCQQTKKSEYFAGRADEVSWCAPCDLQREYKHAECRICNKEKKLTEFPLDARRSDTEEDGGLAICLKCKPAKTLYRCTVCENEKAPSDFLSLAGNRSILRCRACHTCTVCGQVQNDLRRFRTNAQAIDFFIHFRLRLCHTPRPLTRRTAQADNGPISRMS